METLGASEMWKDFGFAGASGCSPWHRMDGSVALLLSCPAAPVACAVTGIEHFTHALENLQQSFTQRPVFPGLCFPTANMSSGHTGVGTAALACSGAALGGSMMGRAQQLTGPLCLVQHFSLQGTCVPSSSVPCRLAVMPFRVSLRSTCSELTQGCL